MVYIDEVEVDQEGIADMMLDESSIAQVAREYIIVPAKSFTHQPIKQDYLYTVQLSCSRSVVHSFTGRCFNVYKPQMSVRKVCFSIDLRLFWFGQVQERH